MTDTHDEEPVGYGKPPKATRFRKGRSGNPCGRPKRTRTQLEVLRRELSQRVTVTEAGRKRRLTKGELIAKQLVTRAVKGEVAALRMMLRVNELMDAEVTREGDGEISEKDRLAADQAVFDAIAAMVAEPEGE
tara:strand:- start:339 stop:737 length:399 start_codon:yes stop_codon:yes gene_type:complete